MQTNKTTETLEAPGAIAGQPVTSADGNRIVAGLRDGRVIVWTGRRSRTGSLPVGTKVSPRP